MKKQGIKLGVMAAISGVLMFCGLLAAPVMATDPFKLKDCPGYDTATDPTIYNSNATQLSECFVKDSSKGGLMSTLQTILNVIFGVIGFVAVVMLVYGGIQYTISSGDSAKVKKAKDTILYGIVGLIIALLAAAIVNFVLVNLL